MTQSKTVTKSQYDQKAFDALTTTSARIRYLDSIGMTRSQIADKLGKRYQHVRNVLITPVGKPK